MNELQMADPLSIAASVVSVGAPALRGTRLLLRAPASGQILGGAVRQELGQRLFEASSLVV